MIVLTPNMASVGNWEPAEPQPPILAHARCTCGGQLYTGVLCYMRRPIICRECGLTFSDSAIKPLLDAYPPPWSRS